MDRVPQGVDVRDLVGEELDETHEAAGRQHGGMLQDPQSLREIDPAQEAGRADQEHHGVEPDAAGPPHGRGQREQVRGVENG
jgi:hypothetical protein